jgi:hypothetical protein
MRYIENPLILFTQRSTNTTGLTGGNITGSNTTNTLTGGNNTWGARKLTTAAGMDPYEATLWTLSAPTSVDGLLTLGFTGTQPSKKASNPVHSPLDFLF